jgi:hypothetical protein
MRELVAVEIIQNYVRRFGCVCVWHGVKAELELKRYVQSKHSRESEKVYKKMYR